MNASEKVNFISNWIKDYVNDMPSKAQSLVIGISGGIDSSVSSTLSAMTGLKTIVLSMPIKQKSQQHDLSLKHQEWLVSKFKNVAHQIGLNDGQVNAIIDFQINEINNASQVQDSQMNVQREEAEKSLKEEWGYDYDKNLRSAMRAVDVYGDEELKEVLKGPAGNSLAMARFLHRIGQEVTEEMAKNTQNNTIAASVLDAKQEIEQIMADPKNPYFDARHKDHKAMVDRMRQLHEKVYGN